MPRHSFIQMSKLPNVKGRISYINVSSMKKIKLKEWKIPIKTVIMVITTKPKTESKGIFHGRAINTDIL